MASKNAFYLDIAIWIHSLSLQPYMVDCSSRSNLTQIHLKPFSLNPLVKESKLQNLLPKCPSENSQKPMASTQSGFYRKHTNLPYTPSQQTLYSVDSLSLTGNILLNECQEPFCTIHPRVFWYKSHSKLNYNCMDLSLHLPTQQCVLSPFP